MYDIIGEVFGAKKCRTSRKKDVQRRLRSCYNLELEKGREKQR